MVSSGRKDDAYSMSAAAIQKEKDDNARWDEFYEAVFLDPNKPTNDPLAIFYRNNYKFFGLDFFAK